MKKALILFWHGIGDVLMMTPSLRKLYEMGYVCDIMCRKSVITSKLLDECKYVNKLIEVKPSTSSIADANESKARFESIKDDYDWSGQAVLSQLVRRTMIEQIAFELCLEPLLSLDMEVFIPEKCEIEATEWVNTHEYVHDGYIFNHTMIDLHPGHNWDSSNWIKKNLPDLPVIDTGVDQKHYCMFNNINTTFVLARGATHRVLSSSVMIHACDAMNCVFDILNYENNTPHKVVIRPIDKFKIKYIRVGGFISAFSPSSIMQTRRADNTQ